METTLLSESAVATLQLRMRGLSLPVTERRLLAYLELAAAGIMEATPNSEYRFTAWGLEHREVILGRERERIERDRHEPPDGELSDLAKGLLRRISSGESVEVDAENRPAFRELAAARVVMLGHTFAKGYESGYRFTYWGWKMKDELLACAKEIA